MTAIQQILLDLQSESEDEERFIMLHRLSKKRKRSKTNEYFQIRKSHGEFTLSSEIPDSMFKESFRLNRKQFSEVHELIKNDITGQECYAQKPIGSEEKLAVCLR